MQFSWCHFTQASVRTCSSKYVILKVSENLQENNCARVFFLDEVAHHQPCNFIKKRLQRRIYTANLGKLLKALCRTPPVSASDFKSTFLNLRPRKTYIYVFPALLFFTFLNHFMFLVEAWNKSIWFYTESIFDVLMY